MNFLHGCLEDSIEDHMFSGKSCDFLTCLLFWYILVTFSVVLKIGLEIGDTDSFAHRNVLEHEFFTDLLDFLLICLLFHKPYRLKSVFDPSRF